MTAHAVVEYIISVYILLPLLLLLLLLLVGKYASRYLLLGTESLIIARDETATAIVNIVPLRSELEYG